MNRPRHKSGGGRRWAPGETPQPSVPPPRSWFPAGRSGGGHHLLKSLAKCVWKARGLDQNFRYRSRTRTPRILRPELPRGILRCTGTGACARVAKGDGL